MFLSHCVVPEPAGKGALNFDILHNTNCIRIFFFLKAEWFVDSRHKKNKYLVKMAHKILATRTLNNKIRCSKSIQVWKNKKILSLAGSDSDNQY